MNEERKKMVADHQKVLKAEKRHKALDRVADVVGEGLAVAIVLAGLYAVLHLLVVLWTMGLGWIPIIFVALAAGVLVWLLLSKKTNDTLKEAKRNDRD